MKLSKHILLFLVLSSFWTQAQKLNLQKFSVKEGLIQSTVKQIEEDKYGNLWLATNNGLSKFNGKDFENFTTTNGLPSNEVSSLIFANDILFIGTKKGFCSYDGYSVSSMPLFDKIRGNIKKMVFHKDVLHILSNKGYYLLDLSQEKYKLDSIAIPNIVSQNPSDAAIDDDGNMWISTLNRGLFFIERTISTKIPKFVLISNSISSTVINNKLVRIANFNSNNLLRGESISCIEFDKQQNLIVSDWNNGLAKIKFDFINNRGLNAEYLDLDSLTKEHINLTRFVAIDKDEEGNLYLASDGFGFLKVPIDKNINENDFSSSQVTLINTDQGFFGNNPLCFKQDENKNLWIGTLYDGLILMNNKSSLSYNKGSGLLEEKVISIYRTSDSALWCGTYGGGAFRYMNKKFTRCFWENGISESIIKSITEDMYGNLLLGTYGGGISIISNDDKSSNLQVSKVISETNNLSNNHITFLYRAGDGSIWVGYNSDNNIDRLVINRDLSFTLTSFPVTKLSKFSPTCITEDDDQNIWITSLEGVWVLDPKTGRVNSEYDLFKNVQTINEDWNGNMWLGTSDIGVIILKNKLKARYFENASASDFEKLKTEDGISSNCVNSILFSKESTWLISNNGINEIKIDYYLNKIKEIKSYNKGHGFASYDNKPNTAVFDNDGIIWIGSVEGLTQYQNLNETNGERDQRNLIVYINALMVEGKNLDWTKKDLFSKGEYSSITFDGFFNWYKIPKNLELDYNHNSVRFYLNTNNIADQKQMNYSYKLVGYDKQWNNLFASNEIVYRNLPSGEYNLVIKASISNDFSKSQEFNYHFSVRPPFWKTTVFYVLMFMGLVAGLYFFVRNREKRLKREKMKLELEVKSRTSEIENKKREIELQSQLIQGINKDMTDSIKYAHRIQQTILPNPGILKNYFTDHFIYYKPRNIVSGDYYWMKELDNLVFVAVVDCTGHGVPGAFMSLITSNILNESVNTNISQYSPAKMLEYLRAEIFRRFSQSSSDQINDGLDISLICYDKSKKTLEYVNANRPLYIITNNELITLTSENVSIGGYADLNSVIPSKTIHIKEGDLLCLFTDGITDQFGGDRNKKYNPARLRQFLLMNEHLPLATLHERLDAEISEWQGTYEQTDDILFIGLKV